MGATLMIEVRKLTKRFGTVLAVNDVSFRAESGEILALVGPNGSGKSTTMKCIAGLISPTAGEIVVNGKRANGGRREWLSYLPQEVGFSENLTGEELIGFYSRLRNLAPGAIQHALEISGLNGFGKRAVREYSVGMLQRLGIAIALMPETPVVILDEPTAGLDSDAVAKLRELLASMRARGQTVIVSTHVLSEIESLADRVAILSGGRLVACEPISSFRERLAQQARMRITLRQPENKWCETARSAGARSAEMAGSELVITTPSANYLPVLRALGIEGANIEHFSTEEPTLESLYLRCIRENSRNHAGN